MTEPHHTFDALKKSLEGFSFARTLSGALLIWTVVFVMIAEILIYVPSIANFRQGWLQDRLAAAQTASLALEATMGEDVKPELESELLANAGALQISLQRNEARILMLAEDTIPMVEERFDLRDAGPLTLIRDAFSALIFGGERTILVIGEPGFEAGEMIEIILHEAALHDAMLTYSRNILTLSLIISAFSAVLIFIRLRSIFVKPMDRLAKNMLSFRTQPEDANRIITPTSNMAEIRMAEQELATMQTEIRQSLNQKTRLAALGTAVSKINHDLRNILASAQLMSDRLAASDDPKVQRLSPKLVSSIDRAVNLATDTLKYGKAEEPPPHKTQFLLAPFIDDIGTQLGLPEDGHITWRNTIDPATEIYADADQLYRVLFNLGRNAALAIDSKPTLTDHEAITISAEDTTLSEQPALSLIITDTGPGFPEKAREHLFEAFSGSARKGGTGLGLAIAKELTIAHGGTIHLEESSDAGTTFRITLPLHKSRDK